MQFQVPQNIDLEDKIVGPLTLTQFLYCLGGGLIDYLLFQSLAKNYMAIFVLIGAPVALIALALAFFKVQEQPLSHFLMVGILYITRPKTRLWQRQDFYQSVLTEPMEEKKETIKAERHHFEKSELEQLDYNLDTVQPDKPEEKKKFGMLASAFEQILKEQPAPQGVKK
jgi:hypothetical protein